MGQDDRDEGGPDGCPGHMWLMQGATLGRDGAHSDYGCELCGALLVVPPGGVFPPTC